jgi:2-dehydropantoate 2-reductase
LRIAIVGAGGVGGYFGGRWAEAGHDVILLARGPHLEALRARGLILHSPLGQTRLHLPAAEAAEEVGEVDLIVLTTKAWQLPSAAEGLGPMVGRDTLVFGLQNGVEAAGVLAGFFPRDRVLGGTCRIISFIREPGVIQHVGVDPTVVFGPLPGSGGDRAERVSRELEGARGVTLRLSDDIESEIWRKFLFFAPVSGVGSVTRAPIGVIRQVPRVREILKRAVQEVYQVAVAKGIGLPGSAVTKAMQFIDAVPPDGTSSMQRDFRDGRRTELEALSGAIVRFGADLAMEVPVHSMLYAALLPLELRARGTLEFSGT